MNDQWILASNNRGKLQEFQTLFDSSGLNIDFIPQGQLGIKDAVEDGLSFIENAIIKARHAAYLGKRPALADDSGLCVPILNHAPGIYSARFAGEHGDDNANNQKLLSLLQEHHKKGEVICAYFVCVLVLVRHADDPLPLVSVGKWHGQIISEQKGENGFGYDPLFLIPELNKTSAQLDKQTKNNLSHRGLALRQLITMLKNQ